MRPFVASQNWPERSLGLLTNECFYKLAQLRAVTPERGKKNAELQNGRLSAEIQKRKGLRLTECRHLGSQKLSGWQGRRTRHWSWLLLRGIVGRAGRADM